MNRFFIMCLLALVIGPLSQGCSEEEKSPGRVKISWQVAGSTCAKAGITDVHINLIEDDLTVLTEREKCTAGSVIFNDVPTGVYDVQVRGYDKNDNPIYEGTETSLSVKSGETPSEPANPVELKPKTGFLMLRWKFPPDFPGECLFNDVKKVEVNVSQASTVLELFTGEFPCSPSDLDIEPAVPLDNGWYIIENVPAGEIEIFLFGLSEDGERMFFGEEIVDVQSAGQIQLTITLNPCEGQCI
jgi:hypothetical protein